MCIIKAKAHNAAKRYICLNCNQIIGIGDRYMRIFGMAHSDEKPYEVKVHISCLKYVRKSPRNNILIEELDRESTRLK